MSQSHDETPKPPWGHDYFALLPNPTGIALLMLPSSEGWQLPCVRPIGVWLSEAAQIIEALRPVLGIEQRFTILRYVAIELNVVERRDRVLFVLEPQAPITALPLNGQWIDQATLQTLPLAAPEQRAPLLRYLDERAQGENSPLISPLRAPWARNGWFAEAAAWIEAAINELGYIQSGPVQQLRNWSISSLLVAPTTAGKLFFKAAAALPLFVNEPALTRTLAKLHPKQLPTPLKIDREKRWMLMENFGPSTRDASGEAAVDYAAIFGAYGQLQRESAGQLDALRDAGCIDRRLAVLATQIDPLIADSTTQAVLTPEEYAELIALAPELKARCAKLADYNLPVTLLHGDLHPGNITQCNGVYLFFDWTDAAIGFPFVDLFLLYFSDIDKEQHVRDAYLSAWEGIETPARLREAWELAKPLCALHHAVSYLTIVNHIEPLTRDELLHGLPDNLHDLLGAMRA